MTFRNAIVHFLLMNKRLYKKPAFLVTLCLIVAVTALMVVGASGESGFVTITLYAENSNDPISSQIIEELTEEKNVINFKVASTYQEAYSDVENGKSDASWIFSDNMQDGVEEFTEKERFRKPFVEIIQRQDSVFVSLANEKLYSKLYRYLSKSVYENHMESFFGINDQELVDGYYEKYFVDDNLIELEYFNSDDKVEDTNYLLSPLRGMLALLVMLCSISAVMYFINDKNKGVFSWINTKRHIIIEGEYVLVSALNTAVFVLIALGVSGLFMYFPKEIFLMLLYVLSCIGFSVLLGEICRKNSIIGSLLPGLVLIMLVLCPVFLVVSGFEVAQFIFPPFYYLNALYDDIYILYMVIYIAVTFVLCSVFNQLKHLR